MNVHVPRNFLNGPRVVQLSGGFFTENGVVPVGPIHQTDRRQLAEVRARVRARVRVRVKLTLTLTQTLTLTLTPTRASRAGTPSAATATRRTSRRRPRGSCCRRRWGEG